MILDNFFFLKYEGGEPLWPLPNPALPLEKTILTKVSLIKVKPTINQKHPKKLLLMKILTQRVEK